jgi:hypothetical protein
MRYVHWQVLPNIEILFKMPVSRRCSEERCDCCFVSQYAEFLEIGSGRLINTEQENTSWVVAKTKVHSEFKPSYAAQPNTQIFQSSTT